MANSFNVHKPAKVTFKDVRYGQIFYCQDKLYMKIYNDEKGSNHNAISLRTGSTCHFADNTIELELVNSITITWEGE